MTHERAASNVRRQGSSLGPLCARAALGLLLLAGATTSRAQELSLPPANDGDQTAPAEQLAEEEIPDPGAALEKPLEPPPPSSVAETSVPTAESSAPAADSPPPKPNLAGADGALQLALARRGSLDLHDVELRAALFMISKQWGINIVAGKVEGSVNGVFRNAPLREILDSILLSNGYNYRAVGESLVVSSIDDLGQINPFFQSATIPVRSADIDEVVQGAMLLTTPQGQVQPIKSAHSIVVLDFPDRVKMIRDFVASIDRASNGGVRAGAPLEVGYFRTQHISAKVAEEALQAVLSKEGRIGVMDKDDRLVISDHAENIAMIGTVLERIDRPRPQVRIRALIYDISLQDVEELGINWREIMYHTGEGNNVRLGIDPINKSPLPETLGAANATIAFGTLSPHFDINTIVAALNNANDARLLADPSVAVLDNEEAIFQSVSEIPYQQLTQTSAGGDIGTTAFKEAGITLRVIPKIAADGSIRMTVSPEFSRLTGFTPGDNQPIIDKRLATTTLAVANRQTVVIGGLRERRDVGDFRGIPYLMDMRYVGKLFRYRKTDVRESELVLFISPEIISAADPVNSRQQRIIDTVGCRLNQIPAGEGCLPPPCACQPLRQPLDLSLAPVAGPMATAMPRRLPPTDTSPMIPIAVQGNDLFSPPSKSEVDLSVPDTTQPRIGGWIGIGSGATPLSQ